MFRGQNPQYLVRINGLICCFITWTTVSAITTFGRNDRQEIKRLLWSSSADPATRGAMIEEEDQWENV